MNKWSTKARLPRSEPAAEWAEEPEDDGEIPPAVDNRLDMDGLHP